MREELLDTTASFNNFATQLQATKAWENYGGDVDAIVEAWRAGLVKGNRDFMSDMQGFIRTRDDFLEQETGVTDYLDNLQKEVEARSGGMLTLQRLFEDGQEVTTDIVIIPNAQLEDPNAISDLLGSTGANGDGGEAERLKTWADYFADITGIAGEAFAQYEKDSEGKIVGFYRGNGKLAGQAYARAFSNELETAEIVTTALGNVFTLEDEADILEDQIDTAFSDITNLLSARAAKLNKEGLTFNVAELLESDSASVEEMLSVFELTDDGVQRIIQTAKEAQSSLATVNMEQLITSTDEALTKFRQNVGKKGFFEGAQDLDYFNTLQDAIPDLENQLQVLYDQDVIDAEEFIKALNYLKEIKTESAEVADSFAVVNDTMNSLPSITDIASNSVYDFTRELGASQEAAWALGSILGSAFDSAVTGLSSVVNELGTAVAQSEDLDDAWGSYALSLAETVSQLAVTAGLQLIVANPTANLGIGLAMIAAGLAGEFVTGYASGLDENATGGIYDGGVKKYAKGGTFANSIVDTPTYFNNGSAVMGEAGPEAIIPLTRSSNGELGVNASGISSGGSSGNVSVSVNNYGSDNVEVNETTDAYGNTNIEMTIAKVVSKTIANGGADTAMKSRYGTRVKGL